MPYAGLLADPEFRRDRAKKAGRARTGADYHIAKLTESPLTDDQRYRLLGFLRSEDAHPEHATGGEPA